MTKTFVKKPFLILVTVVIVLVIGGVSLTKMQTDLLPEMELPYMMVLVTDPGASPDEIEEDVVKPLEDGLGTVNGVDNVTSTSSNNYGMVMLEFTEDTDMNSALVRVSQELNTIELPEKCGTPNLMEVSMDMMASMYASVDYEGKDIKELTTFCNDVVKPYLEKQEGVASVTVNGGSESTVEVRLNQDKIDEVNKDIVTETNKKLKDAQNEINDGTDKLAQAEKELKDKQEELKNQESSTYNKLGEGEVALSKAQATKAAYEANLTALKANLAALQGEKKAYKDAKISENYKKLDDMFATFEKSMGDAAKAAGIEIPSSLEDAVEHPEKFKKFKSWMTDLGYGTQLKDINIDTLTQVYNVVKVRIPQINTEIANIKTEIKAAEAMLSTINEKMEDVDGTHSDTLSKGYSAASGFGSGSAQLSAGLSQIESSKKSLEEAQEQLDNSKEAAIENSNIDSLLSLETLSALLTAQNFSMPVGYVDDKNDNQWLVQVGDTYETPDQLNQMVLTKIPKVGSIKLSDIADITVIDQDDLGYVKVNGEDAVMISLYKSSTSSTNTVTTGIKKAFKKLEKENEGSSFTVLMNQGDYIDTILNSVVSSILMGAVLAILVLALFLKDFRSTIVVAFSIPFSVLFALIVMYFTGITMNVMSLAGLCIGIGMLVDNSIVVMENVYRLRGEGYSAPAAAVYGTKQVSGSIIASTITTICVFLPMVYTTGMISQLLMPFAFTVSYALIASLLVALTVVPAMGSVTLNKIKPQKHPFLTRIQDIYGKMLAFCLRFKVVPLGIAIVLLAICSKQVFSTGLSMMDDMESNQISASMTMKEDTADEDAMSAADQAIQKILEVEGVSKVSVVDASVVASSLAGSSANADYSSFQFFILAEDDVKTTKDFRKIIKAIEENTKDLNCEEFVVKSSAMGSSSGLMGSGAEVKIFGEDKEKLVSISEDVMDIMNGVDGYEDVDNGMSEEDKQIHLSFDKNKVARKGLTVAQIYQQLAGKITTEKETITMAVDETNADVTIVNENDAVTYENIMDTELTATVKNSDGEEEQKTYKLSDFATKEDGTAMSSISRENQERCLTVSASVADGENATLLARTLEDKLDQYETPDGYRIEVAGESEQVNEMVKQLLLALLLGFMLIYLVMVAQFQSLLSPFIVIFTVPLAFTGGMLGLMCFHMNITAMSLMGFMILMGTVVNNGIVFVDYVNQLRIKGVECRNALIITGKVRMRPIIMTALTTILSLSVMVVSQDAGNAMQKGMAVVVCFGLLYSTLMTLFIVPVLYDIMYRKPPKVIDVDQEVENISDETEKVLEQYGV